MEPPHDLIVLQLRLVQRRKLWHALLLPSRQAFRDVLRCRRQEACRSYKSLTYFGLQHCAVPDNRIVKAGVDSTKHDEYEAPLTSKLVRTSCHGRD